MWQITHSTCTAVGCRWYLTDIFFVSGFFKGMTHKSWWQIGWSDQGAPANESLNKDINKLPNIMKGVQMTGKSWSPLFSKNLLYPPPQTADYLKNWHTAPLYNESWYVNLGIHGYRIEWYMKSFLVSKWLINYCKSWINVWLKSCFQLIFQIGWKIVFSLYFPNNLNDFLKLCN